MARHQPKDARREPHERARDAEEPGAPSGRKSQGHRPPGGTAQDEALEGVRAHGEDAEQDRGTERTRDDAHGKRTQP